MKEDMKASYFRDVVCIIYVQSFDSVRPIPRMLPPSLRLRPPRRPLSWAVRPETRKLQGLRRAKRLSSPSNGYRRLAMHNR